MGIELPDPPKAIASYIPVKQAGPFLFISGQLPLKNGNIVNPGKVGESVSISDAQNSCETATLNALAAISDQLDKIQIVKLGVYVSSHPDFTDQHLVANGASDLLFQIFGEKGRHSRFAVGVPSLPLNACVELEMVAFIE